METPVDTFLAMTGWTKGIAWINGFNLGRYWESLGPQKTLYIPAPRLQKGANELVVLEMHSGSASLNFSFLGQPILKEAPHSVTACDPTVGAKAVSSCRAHAVYCCPCSSGPSSFTPAINEDCTRSIRIRIRIR